MSISPQCPQETISLTLPPLELQCTVVSSKHISQHPPGNIAVLGGSLPPRRSPEQLDRPSLAGPPLQGTLAALSTSEVSLENDSLCRLSGSVEASAKCVTLGPAHCRKRQKTSIQQGYFPLWWAPSRIWSWNKKQWTLF